MSRLLALALIASVTACQPFYRDKLRAGRRAANTDVMNKLLAEAATAAAAGDLPRAITFARKAIHENPTRPGAFAMLAVYLRRATNRAAADAVVRYAAGRGLDLSYELARGYVDDDLIADALEANSVRDLESTSRVVYGDAFDELLAAAADTNIESALTHYLTWLDTYGIPDHRAVREAAAKIAKRIDDEIQRRSPLGVRLVAVGPHANQASAANDVQRALTLYSLAFRVLSPESFLPYRGAMARAAARVTDASQIDPIAFNLAIDGNEALKAGNLGLALHAYRRAVAHAPWWGAAHGNLAELLALDQRAEEATLERAWADGLAKNGGWATMPDATVTITDLDADKVVDPTDQCPHEPEDVDGFEDGDGCPELDNDRDGVPDAADKCRDVAEDKDGFQDDDGCVDPDNDNDGIADIADACPMQPEVFNGTKDGDGCPDEGRVVITPTSLSLLDPITFDGKTARIAKASSKILDAVGATLVGNKLLTVEVGVHGSIYGKPDLDATLTQARAEAVVTYLIGRGVAAARLTAVGYGNTKPLDPGSDAKTLAKNRRVELTLKAVQ